MKEIEIKKKKKGLSEIITSRRKLSDQRPVDSYNISVGSCFYQVCRDILQKPQIWEDVPQLNGYFNVPYFTMILLRVVFVHILVTQRLIIIKGLLFGKTKLYGVT